jgi:hypothetical protein
MVSASFAEKERSMILAAAGISFLERVSCALELSATNRQAEKNKYRIDNCLNFWKVRQVKDNGIIFKPSFWGI